MVLGDVKAPMVVVVVEGVIMVAMVVEMVAVLVVLGVTAA